MKIGLPAALLFGSGFAALVYQTAWQRMLRLVFGASTGASAAVLAIFLGGLGIGGVWLGKRAERHSRPLLFYAQLEAGIALLAATTPLSVTAARYLYVAVGGSEVLGPLGATIVRLLLSALVMGPAVLLMGGTLPAAVRALEEDSDAARQRLAVAYGANTTGAVAGALLSTFAMFQIFGTRLSLWIAVLLNLLVAVVARGLARGLPPVEVGTTPASGPAAAAAGSPTTPAALVYAAAGLVGFAFIGLELVWYRALAPILGGSSYTFGLVLAVALAGIGLGGLAYARRDAARPASLGLLATTVVLEALAVALPFALSDELALLAAYLRPMVAMGFPALVASWTLVTLAVVFLPALVAGYQFPALVGLLGQGRAQVARHISLTYAFNTAGSILGALAVGFVLIPSAGTPATWRIMVGLLAGLGILLLGFELVRRPRRAAIAAKLAVAAAALAAIAGAGPSAISRHVPIGAGRISIHGLDRNGLRAWRAAEQRAIVWEKDGVESNVGIRRDDYLAVLINGKSDSHIYNDRGTMVLAGLLPSLLHPEPKQAFVLGLATGMTAGWLAAVPSIERVDVAELEPAVVEMARLSAAHNLDVLKRANVHLQFGDGREQLMTTRRRYDIVISEPSNPYRAGVASLYTREFYQAIGERLNPRGLFAQWVQAYEIDVSALRIVLRTLGTVFPEVEIWQTQLGDLLLIAGHTPRTLDVEVLRRRMRAEPFRTALPRCWLVEDVEGILAHFVAGSRLARALGRAFEPDVNTDDGTVLEYAFARHVGRSTEYLDVKLADFAAKIGEHSPSLRGQVDWPRVAEQGTRAFLLADDFVPEEPPGAGPAWYRAQAVHHACADAPDRALAAWLKQPDREPRDALERLAVARGYASASDDRSLGMAEQLGRDGYLAEAELVRAQYHVARGDAEAAVTSLLAGVAALRAEVLPLCRSATATLRLLDKTVRGKSEATVRAAVAALSAGPLVGFAADAYRVRLAQELAFTLSDADLCVRTLGKDLEHPAWERQLLTARWQCLQRAGHPLAARAEQDLGAFLAAMGGRVEAGVELGSKPAR